MVKMMDASGFWGCLKFLTHYFLKHIKDHPSLQIYK